MKLSNMKIALAAGAALLMSADIAMAQAKAAPSRWPARP
jgi:hypothetical protein